LGSRFFLLPTALTIMTLSWSLAVESVLRNI
jgi:hypothetical protein